MLGQPACICVQYASMGGCRCNRKQQPGRYCGPLAAHMAPRRFQSTHEFLALNTPCSNSNHQPDVFKLTKHTVGFAASIGPAASARCLPQSTRWHLRLPCLDRFQHTNGFVESIELAAPARCVTRSTRAHLQLSQHDRLGHTDSVAGSIR